MAKQTARPHPHPVGEALWASRCRVVNSICELIVSPYEHLGHLNDGNEIIAPA